MRVAIIGVDRLPAPICDLLSRYGAETSQFSPGSPMHEPKWEHDFDIVVLMPDLSPKDVVRLCGDVRRHLPAAMLLLVAFSADGLDDPSYDERVSPDASSAEFETRLRHLLEMKRRR